MGKTSMVALPLWLIAYVFGTTGALGLWHMGYPSEAFFYAWLAQVQPVEGILDGLQRDPGNPTSVVIRYLVTLWGILITHTQALVLWWAMISYGGVQFSKYVNAVLILFGVSTLLYMLEAMILVVNGPLWESRLLVYWAWNHRPYAGEHYVLFLFALILLSDTLHCILISSVFLVAFVRHGCTTENGSFWCSISSFTPAMLLLVRHYDLSM